MKTLTLTNGLIKEIQEWTYVFFVKFFKGRSSFVSKNNQKIKPMINKLEYDHKLEQLANQLIEKMAIPELRRNVNWEKGFLHNAQNTSAIKLSSDKNGWFLSFLIPENAVPAKLKEKLKGTGNKWTWADGLTFYLTTKEYSIKHILKNQKVVRERVETILKIILPLLTPHTIETNSWNQPEYTYLVTWGYYYKDNSDFAELIDSLFVDQVH